MIVHTFCSFCEVELKVVIEKQFAEDVLYCPLCKNELDTEETSLEADEDD